MRVSRNRGQVFAGPTEPTRTTEPIPNPTDRASRRTGTERHADQGVGTSWTEPGPNVVPSISNFPPDHPDLSGTYCSTNIKLVECGATRYTLSVIRSFRHKGVERFFRTGSKAGIQAAHAPRLARQLAALNVARQPSDMNVPGWGLHPLKGKLSNHWSVSVSGNWRLTFKFNDSDAELVDYQDYH